MTFNRRAAAKPSYRFVTSCQQGIDDQRNLRLSELVSQRTIAGRHHHDENAACFTPFCQVADDQGGTA